MDNTQIARAASVLLWLTKADDGPGLDKGSAVRLLDQQRSLPGGPAEEVARTILFASDPIVFAAWGPK